MVSSSTLRTLTRHTSMCSGCLNPVLQLLSDWHTVQAAVDVCPHTSTGQWHSLLTICVYLSIYLSLLTTCVPTMHLFSRSIIYCSISIIYLSIHHWLSLYLSISYYCNPSPLCTFIYLATIHLLPPSSFPSPWVPFLSLNWRFD